jgi:hypothetical protein
MSEPSLSKPGFRLSLALDARVVLGALVLGTSAMAARGVESFYPFSVFPMYSGEAGTASSRIMARSAEGGFVEVTAFERWQCDALPVLEKTTCAGVGGIPYVDREREQHIRTHAGTGGQPIELVRRVFSFDDVPRPTHCTIVRCTAVAR